MSKELTGKIHLLETEIKHLSNDLQLTREEYETARRNYYAIYSKLAKINDQLNQEIVEKKNAQDALAIRLQYEEGLANFSRALLLTSENSIDKGIKYLHQAVNVTRVWILENQPETNKGISAVLAHERNSRGYHSMKNHPLLNPLYFNDGLVRWKQELLDRHPIFGLTHEMDSREREILEELSIESLLVLPVFVNEAWWGMICFIDNSREKKWRSVDLRVLQTASEMLGSYIERRVAEENLKKAKKVAEDANRLKSQFVFNVSHEMRTPLNSIIGFTESIQHSDSFEMIRDYSNTVLQQSEMLLLLISDLLDLAKIEAGKMMIEQRPFDLRSVLNKLLNSVGILASAKNLELRHTWDEKIPALVLGDELRLMQILMNLCGNAVKFTETGHVEISFRVENLENDKCSVGFHVIDTGIGIPKSRQKQIFNSFTQADGSITRKYGGTGLGITIANQLIELFGGELKVKSEPGKGSHFWFVVPYGIAQADQAELQKIHDNQLHHPKKRGKILLVDDYWPNMQVALQHLKECDCVVDTADNGFDAIELCKNKAYDLILLDLQMPGISGYDTAVQLRKNNSLCTETPIIAITAHADSTTREQCYNVGIADVVSKPLRRAMFVQQVKRWLAWNNDPQLVPETVVADEIPLDENPDKLQAPPVLDYDRAIIEFGGNEKVLENVLEHFLIDIENQQVAFRNAFQKKDFKKLSADAHRIRGGAANLTAIPLSQCAEKIELYAKENQIKDMEHLFSDFDQEAEKLLICIKERNK